MIRRVFTRLKPFGLALVVLALAPCVIEFVLRLSACQSGFSDDESGDDVATIPSWHTHHELAPFQAIDRPAESSADEPAETVEFRTNSIGLRGSEIVVPKPDGVFRVVCIGDETVLAAEIAEKDTFCKVLERQMQALSSGRIEVINAGVPDYCPVLSFLQVRHRLAGLDPDLIIAHFDMTDVWDDQRFRRLTDIDASEQPLVCINPSLSNEPRIRPLTENFLTWRWAQDSLGGVFGGAADRPGDDAYGERRTQFAWLSDESGEATLPLSLALSAWQHLADFCRGRNTRLILAVHPAPWQVSPTASPGARQPHLNGVYPGTEFDSDLPFERIREFAREQQLPLCDVSPAFRGTRNPDDLFQTKTRGFSPAGHELYAAQLVSTLRRVLSGPSPSNRQIQPASATRLPSGARRLPLMPGQMPAGGTSANAPRSLVVPNDLAPIPRQE